MNIVLNILCDLEDKLDLKKEEEDAFDIAIQCVTTVLNRMVEDRPISWGEELDDDE